MKNVVIRIVLDVILFMSVYLFPWWLIILGVLMALFINSAPELIVIGLLLDALYDGASPTLPNFQFTFTALFIIMFFSVEFLKRYIILYENK